MSLRPHHACLAAATALAALAACAQREASPEATYRAFVRAVSDRDADRAWGLLSKDTQAWLEARAKDAAAHAPGVVTPSGRDLLLGDAVRAARPVAEVILRRESRDRAVLQVTEEGGTPREVELVREGGWRVRLPPPS
jgi:hypothetical protein